MVKTMSESRVFCGKVWGQGYKTFFLRHCQNKLESLFLASFLKAKSDVSSCLSGAHHSAHTLGFLKKH
jgi:hypothetical protein